VSAMEWTLFLLSNRPKRLTDNIRTTAPRTQDARQPDDADANSSTSEDAIRMPFVSVKLNIWPSGVLHIARPHSLGFQPGRAPAPSKKSNIWNVCIPSPGAVAQTHALAWKVAMPDSTGSARGRNGCVEWHVKCNRMCTRLKRIMVNPEQSEILETREAER
jgi:hypothetical protein